MFTKKLFGFDGLKVFLRGGYELLVDNLSSGTEQVTALAEGDNLTGDALDPESNVEYVDGQWKNKSILVNETTAVTFTDGVNASLSGTASGTYTLLFNANTGDGNVATSSTYDIILDFGADKSFSHFEIFNTTSGNWIVDFHPERMNFYIGPSNVGPWTLMEDVGTYTRPDAGQSIGVHPLTNPQTGRYVKVNSTGGWNEMSGVFLYSAGGVESTNNTFKLKPVSNATANWAPGTLAIKSANSTEITSGQANVAYSFDDVTYSSLIDIDAFRNLSKSIFSSKVVPWLQIQIVGAYGVNYAEIKTEGTKIKAGTTLSLEVDGIEKANLGSNEFKLQTQMYSVPVALTSTANAIAVDCSKSNNFSYLTTENSTISEPTNLKAGAYYRFYVTQDASTPYTLAWNAVFKGSPTALTASVNAEDMYLFYCPDGVNLVLTSDNILQLDAVVSGSSLNVVDLDRYDGSAKEVIINLVGIITEDFTLVMPPVTPIRRKYTIIDTGNNGLSNPDYILKIVPDGTDSITVSHLDLTDEYEFDFDGESASFISNLSVTKWEGV